MLLWMRCAGNMPHMFLIPLQLYGIKPPEPDTHTHRYTSMQSIRPRDLRVPLIMFLPWVPPLFIKTQTWKGGADRSRVAKKGCWDGVLQPVWLGVWERVWRCVFLGGWKGVYGNWLYYYTTWLRDTHPLLSARDPPLPRQQFAVWVAQRGGQRSNKCSEMEVLSHGNAVTNNSASFQGC